MWNEEPHSSITSKMITFYSQNAYKYNLISHKICSWPSVWSSIYRNYTSIQVYDYMYVYVIVKTTWEYIMCLRKKGVTKRKSIKPEFHGADHWWGRKEQSQQRVVRRIWAAKIPVQYNYCKEYSCPLIESKNFRR